MLHFVCILILHIHSCIDRQLDCFHILAIVKMIAWAGVCEYLFESSLSMIWSIYPKSEIDEALVILFLIFQESPRYFP